MPRTAIVDATGAILALAAPSDPERALPLPEGMDGAALVTLADAEVAKLDTPDSRFTYDGATGLVTAVPVVQPAPAPDLTAAADVAAYTAIEQATTVDELKAVILAWMQSRPGIAT